VIEKKSKEKDKRWREAREQNQRLWDLTWEDAVNISQFQMNSYREKGGGESLGGEKKKMYPLKEIEETLFTSYTGKKGKVE